jgi:hypothetical protein
MIIRYAVNKLIRKKDAYSPMSRVFFITSNKEISISTVGILQAIELAYEVIKGDLLN